ncbi:nucleotide sugar dehydrogenase [Arenibaculum pallidiluteum]|uniref:nucleotide sugar dehydrogenase n=1 Tax=Arenibaculum pallidiluteum TaxID=2812559 RepID=UPI001A96BDE2|nr:nucleotide sugar dehydrogenase [Arenibaculum pallidiluteum]
MPAQPISAFADVLPRSADRSRTPVSGTPVVCVQGLGFVGAAMAAAVASARGEDGRPAYAVIGVDLPTEDGRSRIAAMNRGAFPFATTDEELKARIAAAHEAGNLSACDDPAAFASASVILVDVPLDVERHRDVPRLALRPFLAALATVGAHMAPDALVIIETTVPPGTTERVAAPILREELSRRGLPTDRMRLAHAYERLMPGDRYYDSVVNMPRVFAGIDARSAEACEAFLATVIDVERHPLTRLSGTTASEVGKVLENTFRAVTIALMDEWGGFAERTGVDLFEVVSAIRNRPTHRNIRTPGFGVGGYCLTKDPLMGWLAAREIFGFEQDFPISRLAVEINRDMPMRTLDTVRRLLDGSLEGRRILLLGLSYREGVGDTRSSPSEVFYRAAREQGAEVAVHDPLVGRWREQDLDVPAEIPPAEGFDAVVTAVPHEEYRSFDFRRWLGGRRLLFVDAFDVLGSGRRRELRALGCRVESIGRGEGL